MPFDPRRFLNAGVKEGDTSEFTAFEAPDPVFWVPSGYAVVNVDIRGTWYSEGTAHYLAPEEAQDFYDTVEWAGTQPWSNGKVGLSGVSYLAQLQWRVAELNPPHLAAINPWEGWTDSYREVATHGGIPDTHFWPTLWNRWATQTSPSSHAVDCRLRSARRVSHQSNPASEPTVITQAKTKPKVILNSVAIPHQNSGYLLPNAMTNQRRFSSG